MTAKFQLGARDFARLIEIVQAETGNRLQEKNHPMLESRMRTHALKLGLPDMAAYWEHFERNEDEERSALQGLMTTHHTFFFREFAHFEVLSQWLARELPRLKARHRATGRGLRLWSAASSRGQEAYSLAMHLDEQLAKEGLPYEIVGTDIDAQSVAYAKNAVYPIKETTAIPMPYLQRYWKRGTGAVAAFAALRPELAARCRFETLNLLETGAWPETQSFDVIFCRNVLIYFADADVERIVLSLAGRLAEGGLFVSGLSEALRFPSWTLPVCGPSSYLKPLSAGSAPASEPRAVETASPAPAHAADAYRVLCVDDSPTIQKVLRKIFESDPRCRGVDIAGHGLEARDLLARNRYDLITLDIHMPEMGGLEFLEKAYRPRQDPPVLMVSSVSREDADLATRALALGAVDYVEKPAMNRLQQNANELLAKVHLALRSGGASAEAGNAGAFDRSISRKIVVPDASQCVRVVAADFLDPASLATVLAAQREESRSPPLLVAAHGADAEGLRRFEAAYARSCALPLMRLADASRLLRPNHVYWADASALAAFAPLFAGRAVSLQLLHDSDPAFAWPAFKGAKVLQLLVEEGRRLDAASESELRRQGFRLSDRTPATSFASLSLEFFAGLRKAAA